MEGREREREGGREGITRKMESKMVRRHVCEANSPM